MILPVKWKTTLTLLPPEDIAKIHTTSLDILNNTGMHMPLGKKRLDALSDFGLKVNRKTERVCFPPQIVENALQKAPSKYTLYARNPDNDLLLDGLSGYLCLDGTGLNVLDLDSGRIRNSTCDDLADITRVADYLPQISFVWPCVSAQERPTKTQPLHELQAMLLNTEKHIQAMTAVDPLTARGTVEMAAAVAGGKKQLRERPLISNFQSTISPLTCSTKGMEAALIFAEAGIPVGFVTMQIGCATAPATVAAIIAQGNAEILGAITFLQLFHPGAPTFYGSFATMMDLKSGGITSGNPEDFLLQVAAIQMARHYNIPITIGTFATGATYDDWRSGVENSISCAVSLFSGGDMLCGAGQLAGATIFSYEQLLKDCEIFDMLRLVTQGLSVTNETLAMNEFQGTGLQTHFMTTDHTLKHMHDIWQPNIKGCRDPELNTETRKSPSDIIAAEKAREILQTHCPKSLPNAETVGEILEHYDRLTIEEC